MDLFKERVLIIVKEAAFVIGVFAVFGLLAYFTVSTPILSTILYYTVMGLFIVGVVVCVCIFIKWLFIEPFKSRNKKLTKK